MSRRNAPLRRVVSYVAMIGVEILECGHEHEPTDGRKVDVRRCGKCQEQSRRGEGTGGGR